MRRVTAAAGAGTLPGMPPKPNKAAMTADELRELVREHGFATQDEFADAIGVHRVTANRWLRGKTPVSLALKLLILEKLKNRKK